MEQAHLVDHALKGNVIWRSYWFISITPKAHLLIMKLLQTNTF